MPGCVSRTFLTRDLVLYWCASRLSVTDSSLIAVLSSDHHIYQKNAPYTHHERFVRFVSAPVVGVDMVENVIWPAALDSRLSRNEGRRVSLELAVENPTVDEIARAVQQIGYDAVIERDKTYSREYESRGRVLIQNADEAGKSDLLQAIAAYVGALR